jgi:hypothetical protein
LRLPGSKHLAHRWQLLEQHQRPMQHWTQLHCKQAQPEGAQKQQTPLMVPR